MFGNAKKEDVRSVEKLVASVNGQLVEMNYQVGRIYREVVPPATAEPKVQVPMHTMRREEAKNFYGGGVYLIV